jgi:hypothetical protein
MIHLKLQKPRAYNNLTPDEINGEILNILDLSEKFDISYMEVLETIKMLENRRSNDITVDSGNIIDEHLHEIKQMINIYLQQYCS